MWRQCIRNLAVTLLVVGWGTSALALDGKGVAVVTYIHASWFGSVQAPNISRLLVSQMSGSSVTRQDTILRNGRFYYPTWSFDGTRIAFYRSGHGVSIIDADGSNLRDIARTVDFGNTDREQSIAWPGIDGGKWVYYHKPCNSGCFRDGSGEIWKVNVDDTAQKVLVCDYKKNNDRPAGSSAIPTGLYKFSLSADAKYAAVHTNGAASDLGYNPGIIAHTFPPQGSPNSPNPWSTSPACTKINECHYGGDCNSALSPSGKILYHFSGNHSALYANYWDHTAETITPRYDIGTGSWGSLNQYTDVESWLTSGAERIGATFNYPRASGNSDQVVTQIVGWQYGADYMFCGNNLVVTDWKDKQATMMTNNPEPPHPNGYVPDGLDYWYAEPGDFWQSGGVAGCYEDVCGAWVDVTTGETKRGCATQVRDVVGVTRTTATFTGTASVYDLRGTRLYSFDARTANRTAMPRIGYVVTGGSVRTILPGNFATSR